MAASGQWGWLYTEPYSNVFKSVMNKAIDYVQKKPMMMNRISYNQIINELLMEYYSAQCGNHDLQEKTSDYKINLKYLYLDCTGM